MDILYQIGEVVKCGLLIVFIALIVLIFVVLIMGASYSPKQRRIHLHLVSVDNATPGTDRCSAQWWQPVFLGNGNHFAA